MKLSEIIKALEDGKDVKVYAHAYYTAQYYKERKRDCIDEILNDIACNRTFEIVEPNKVVEITGWYDGYGWPSVSDGWNFAGLKMEDDTHKITFEVDKDNKPICETIKMIEL